MREFLHRAKWIGAEQLRQIMSDLGFTLGTGGTGIDAASITTGTIDSARLPSYVDDVVEVANYAALPISGETGKIYITIDTSATYRWSGSAYILLTVDMATTIHAATSKTTPVDADEIGLVDSAASNVLKKLTLTNLWTYIKTKADALYPVTTLSWSDVSASGAIGTAAATVDLSANLMIIQNQTTTTKLLSLPTPTDTSKPRKVTWINTGTARIWTDYQRLILPGGSATFNYVPSVGWKSDSRVAQTTISYGTPQSYPSDTNANDITMQTIPGGFMKLNDSISIRLQLKNTSGANSKTMNLYFGGTSIYSNSSGLATALASMSISKTIQNIAATNAQRCSPATSAYDGGGAISTSSPTLVVDTANDVALNVRVTKSVGGDSTSLEFFSIQYIPGQTS